jgi:hypothetical protein
MDFVVVMMLMTEPTYRCVRWAWTGDVYHRIVYCLEWKKVEKK